MTDKASKPPKAPTKATVKPPKPAKPQLGWREWVALPELHVKYVKAKVDTGARSSSIHAENIEFITRGKQRYVRFVLQDEAGSKVLGVSRGGHCEVPLHDIRWITSSNGDKQKRPIIRTTLQIGDQSWPIDLSLSTRASMGFPMLLGREAIRRKFVVDPGRSFRIPDHVPIKKKPKPEK